jgi:hypothetical protein
MHGMRSFLRKLLAMAVLSGIVAVPVIYAQRGGQHKGKGGKRGGGGRGGKAPAKGGGGGR